MTRLAFDTHTFVKRLTQAGMDEQQAEVLVECQVQLIDDSLATKQDIEEVKQDIEEVKRDIGEVKRDIEEVKRDIEALRLATEQSIEKLRLETKKDIETLKTDLQKMELRLTIRLGSAIFVAVGLFATLIKFLP